KMCDLISDAVLDAYLTKDPEAKVACESVAKTGMILLAGEITSVHTIDYQRVVRDTIKEIGYDDSSKGANNGCFKIIKRKKNYKTCNVVITIEQQAQEIARGVHHNRLEDDLGAGDQGIMFGYATDETPECMPLTVVIAHRLNQRLAELRRNGTFWWARPDSKSQVTCEYAFRNGATVPKRVHTIVVSTQHSNDISLVDIRSQIMDKVIRDVVPARYLDEDTIFHINPCGPFTEGGPMLKSEDLQESYRVDGAFNLPEGDVFDAFEELSRVPGFPPELLPVLDYFEDNFLGRLTALG
ncbi:hypothetical protein HPB47_024117, partial [Ixodes persulcatus]